jgi:histidyl-tRNA synthetase
MPTNLKDWIDSKNPSVVKLGIKFMVFYNYLKETQPILNLLQSEDKTIRHEVIVAVNDLLIIGAEQVLIDQFDKEEKTNKIEILKSLSAIGTQKTEKFISDLLINSIDKDLKLEGVYTLNKINPNYLENAFAENLEIRKMVNHVKDPYI